MFIKKCWSAYLDVREQQLSIKIVDDGIPTALASAVQENSIGACTELSCQRLLKQSTTRSLVAALESGLGGPPMKLLKFIDNKDILGAVDTQGYLAESVAEGLTLTLGIRGTTGYGDWLTNLSVAKVMCSHPIRSAT